MHRTTSVTHSRPRRRDSPCRHEVRSGRPTGTPPPPLWSIPPFPGRLTSDPDDPSDFGPRTAGGSGGDDCRVEVGVGRCAHGDCLFDPRCAPRAPSKPWPEAPRPRDAPANSGHPCRRTAVIKRFGCRCGRTAVSDQLLGHRRAKRQFIRDDVSLDAAQDPTNDLVGTPPGPFGVGQGGSVLGRSLPRVPVSCSLWRGSRRRAPPAPALDARRRADYVNSIRPRDDGPTWLQPARDQQQHRAFADALCEAGAHQC